MSQIHEQEMLQVIDQRDKAEESLSQAYYLITGRSPEWSNLFGHEEALEEIDDAQTTLRKTNAALKAQVGALQREKREAQEAYRHARNQVAMICVVLPLGIAENLESCFAHYRTPEDKELRAAAKSIIESRATQPAPQEGTHSSLRAESSAGERTGV